MFGFRVSFSGFKFLGFGQKQQQKKTLGDKQHSPCFLVKTLPAKGRHFTEKHGYAGLSVWVKVVVGVAGFKVSHFQVSSFKCWVVFGCFGVYVFTFG